MDKKKEKIIKQLMIKEFGQKFVDDVNKLPNEIITRKCDFDDEKSCHIKQCNTKCPINPNYIYIKQKD